MTRALQRTRRSQIKPGGAGNAPAVPTGACEREVGASQPEGSGRPGHPSAHAARSPPGPFTFFSSMARRRKRRSQLESGVSFMPSSPRAPGRRDRRPAGRPSVRTRAGLRGRRRRVTSSGRGGGGGAAARVRMLEAGGVFLLPQSAGERRLPT